MMIALFSYAFVSTVAMSIVPHEPVVIWYGAHFGVWATAAVATAGTLASGWVDHRLFVPLIGRVADKPVMTQGVVGRMRGLFTRAPFTVIAVSGFAPVPSFPFKAMAFAERYPLGRYLAAVAVGRFPRYALLAWVGLALDIPTWVFAGLFLLMLVPSVRVLIWKSRNAK